MKVFTFFLAFVFLSCAGQAQSDVSLFNLKKGVAAEGFDMVSYFQGKPRPGNENISTVYKGVKYLFSSAENKEIFLKNPERYVPAYGGWCAYAVGDSNEKVKIDPFTYKIINNRVYLFYNFRGYNTLELWNKRENELLGKADRNWKHWKIN